jgi:hypothetical protein
MKASSWPGLSWNIVRIKADATNHSILQSDKAHVCEIASRYNHEPDPNRQAFEFKAEKSEKFEKYETVHTHTSPNIEPAGAAQAKRETKEDSDSDEPIGVAAVTKPKQETQNGLDYSNDGASSCHDSDISSDDFDDESDVNDVNDESFHKIYADIQRVPKSCGGRECRAMILKQTASVGQATWLELREDAFLYYVSKQLVLVSDSTS